MEVDEGRIVSGEQAITDGPDFWSMAVGLFGKDLAPDYLVEFEVLYAGVRYTLKVVLMGVIVDRKDKRTYHWQGDIVLFAPKGHDRHVAFAAGQPVHGSYQIVSQKERTGKVSFSAAG